jgi:predicted amidophosphoribosyltransferase
MELAVSMGGMMLVAGHELPAEAGPIVPGPPHRFWLWWRRFNQAAALAQVIGRATAVDMLVFRRVIPGGCAAGRPPDP